MLHVRWHSNAQMHYDVSTRGRQIMVLLSSNSLQILQFWGFSCWNCNKDPCVTNTKPYIPPTRKLNSPMRRHFFRSGKICRTIYWQFFTTYFWIVEYGWYERVHDFCNYHKSCILYIASISYLQLVGTICLCNKNRSVNLEVIHHQPTLIPIYRFSKIFFLSECVID